MRYFRTTNHGYGANHCVGDIFPSTYKIGSVTVVKLAERFPANWEECSINGNNERNYEIF